MRRALRRLLQGRGKNLTDLVQQDGRSEVIYPWWDALGNYLTALDYGGGGKLNRWWTGASRPIHLLGKRALRFHAVYWPAMLLSAGQAVSTDIVVHGYLAETAARSAKSSGATVDPYDLRRVGSSRPRPPKWSIIRFQAEPQARRVPSLTAADSTGTYSANVGVGEMVVAGVADCGAVGRSGLAKIG